MINTDIRSLDKIYLYRDRDNIDVERLFNGKTVDELKVSIDELVFPHKDKVIKFYASDYGYDGGVDVAIQIYELETDKEYTKRQKILDEHKLADEKRKAKVLEKKKEKMKNKEEAERKLLEVLKAKYEGK